MGDFHIFKIVHKVPNPAKHLILFMPTLHYLYIVFSLLCILQVHFKVKNMRSQYFLSHKVC